MVVLVINGASGVGKTTAARTLSNKLDRCVWVHPDERWNTPHMSSEAILQLAVQEALADQATKPVIIDCQIRPSAIPGILTSFGISSWLHVLLACPKQKREERLLQRGWGKDNFAVIENWANILQSEARAAGDLLIDTSGNPNEEVCDQIWVRYREYLNTSTEIPR